MKTKVLLLAIMLACSFLCGCMSAAYSNWGAPKGRRVKIPAKPPQGYQGVRF
ncbi:MAG: hypothetical protein HKL88_07170 [Bacteroidia bacterium]|nr:hypothetical protein [Bacteroidia bacterium]